MRECGDCQLCCKLLPIPPDQGERITRTAVAMVDAGFMTAREAATMAPEFAKPAGARCPHQRHHKGCSIYATRPFSCRVWNCRWLVSDDTADLRRPDRSHYVIDIMPDVVRLAPNDGTPPSDVPVIQVWVDPDFPDAYNDPALREYMIRRAHEGIATMVRFDSRRAITIFPPPLNEDGRWHDSRECNTVEPGCGAPTS